MDAFEQPPISPSAHFPADMHVGAYEPLSALYYLVYAYGGRGKLSPGWYVMGRPLAEYGWPLAGPFESRDEAVAAWRASDPDFAFKDMESHLFEPTVVLNKGNLSLDVKARVDSFCKLECGDGILIGRYVHIASFCHLGIGGGVTIFEDGSSAASGTKVLSGSASFDGVSWSATHPAAVNKKAITIIRKNATLLTNSVVLPGCEIGEGAVIGAGAVVPARTVVPPGELWVGVPARKKR